MEEPDTIPAMIRAVATARGDHPAVVTSRETLSYAELDRRSAVFACGLLSAGCGKGARVGLLAPDGVDWIVAYLGALRMGALLTTISTLCAPPELAHILRNSDCQHLIAARRFLTHDYAQTLEAALPELHAAPAEPGALRLAPAPYLRSIWLDDAEGAPWARPVEQLSARADDRDEALLRAVEAEVTPGEDAVVVYTSGSTAQPKAIVHRHWALTRHSRLLADQFALKPADRMMPLLPSFWLAGMSTMLQVLTIGATLVYPDSPAIEDALDAIVRFDVTRVNAWGDKQPALVRAAEARGLDISHISDLFGFADPEGGRMPPVARMYGMTESCSAHSAYPMDQPPPPGKSGAFGRAIGGYERRVVDSSSGAILSPGETGELQIRGPALMSGMYKRAREAVFTPDGFYPTRDLVRIDADGWLFPAGRIDDMIKTRGANVSRLEVEAALQALPQVAQAVVAGLPDPDAGRLIVAAVVLAEGAEADEASLRLQLRATLSSFKIPRRIVFIAPEDVPRTATGKVRLVETAAMIAARLPAQA